MLTVTIRDSITPSVIDAPPPLSGPDARRAFVMSHLPSHLRGLEIAPYFNPMVDRAKYDVFYVDCIDNDEIRRKASENPGATGRDVPHIDAVWVPGKRLSKCVGGRKFAYAVASHVIFSEVVSPFNSDSGAPFETLIITANLGSDTKLLPGVEASSP